MIFFGQPKIPPKKGIKTAPSSLIYAIKSSQSDTFKLLSITKSQVISAPQKERVKKSPPKLYERLGKLKSRKIEKLRGFPRKIFGTLSQTVPQTAAPKITKSGQTRTPAPPNTHNSNTETKTVKIKATTVLSTPAPAK